MDDWSAALAHSDSEQRGGCQCAVGLVRAASAADGRMVRLTKSAAARSMIAYLEDRAAALMARGWTQRDAGWLALVCLHCGVFLRSQYRAFLGWTNPALAHRFIRRCRNYAVEQPWNGSGLRVCRIGAQRMHRVLGVEHVRHRRPPRRRSCGGAAVARLPARTTAHVVAPDGAGKVDALTAAGIARDVLPRRRYQGALGGVRGTSATSCRSPSTAGRRTFVVVQDEDETESGVRTWGSRHVALWAGLIAGGRAVEVVVERPATARRARRRINSVVECGLA